MEVGSWLGRSTAFLAGLVQDADRGIRFWAVDHGFGTTDKSVDAYGAALAETAGNVAGRLVTNLRDCGVLDSVYPLIVTSERAALLFPDESLDFVFIDADHRYAEVRADVARWWPKVKPGGTIAGHDYDEHWPEVKAAVNDFFGEPCPHPVQGTCWGRVK